MKIALFIPCYINALYPQVGEASYRLLRSLGLDVDYPLDQTCCGQPMANAGYERDAQPLAERMEELFAGYDYVVGPSASCVSFVREGYPRLVPHADGGPCLASRIYEICEFVHDVVRPERLDASFHHKVSIHNSCHGVRLMGLSTPSELNIPYRSKLRDLLALGRGFRAGARGRVLRFRRHVRRGGEGGLGLHGARQGPRPHVYGRRVYHGGRQFVSDAHAGRHRPRTAADKDPAYR